MPKLQQYQATSELLHHRCFLSWQTALHIYVEHAYLCGACIPATIAVRTSDSVHDARSTGVHRYTPVAAPRLSSGYYIVQVYQRYQYIHTSSHTAHSLWYPTPSVYDAIRPSRHL